MTFLKSLAHLLLIWIAVMATLAGAAVLMAAYDMLGDPLGQAIHSQRGNT